MNLSLQRTIILHERTRLQIRVDASNLTNHVNITGISTVVNSHHLRRAAFRGRHARIERYIEVELLMKRG